MIKHRLCGIYCLLVYTKTVRAYNIIMVGIILSQLPIMNTNTNLTMSFKRTLAAERYRGYVLVFKSNYEGRCNSHRRYLRGGSNGNFVWKYYQHSTPRNIDSKCAGYTLKRTFVLLPESPVGACRVVYEIISLCVIWTVLYIVLWTTSTYGTTIRNGVLSSGHAPFIRTDSCVAHTHIWMHVQRYTCLSVYE